MSKLADLSLEASREQGFFHPSVFRLATDQQKIPAASDRVEVL